MIINVNTVTTAITIPYLCEEIPIPIINKYGIANPLNSKTYYDFNFYFQNKEKSILTLSNVVANDTDWAIDNSYSFIDQKTYHTRLMPNKIRTGTDYLKIEVTFPNGFIKSFEVVIPFYDDITEITEFSYNPLTRILSDKISVAMTFKNNMSPYYELTLSDNTFMNFNVPVYGTYSNATAKKVFPTLLNTISSTLYSYSNNKYNSVGNVDILLTQPARPYRSNTLDVISTPNINGYGSIGQVNLNSRNIVSQIYSITLLLSQDLLFPMTPTTQFLEDGAFGIVGGTFDNFNSEINLPISVYSNQQPLIYYVFEYEIKLLPPPPSIVDTTNPVLNYLQVIPLSVGSNRYFIIRASISDDLSGFRMIVFVSLVGKLNILSSKDLIQGDPLNGVYEKVYDNPNIEVVYFHLVDYAANKFSYGSYMFTYDLASGIPISNPLNYGNPQSRSFTYARWSHNDIDVSTIPYSTQFIFNLTNADKYLCPVISYSFDNLPKRSYYGGWNESTQQYEVIVQLPLRMFTGFLQYTIQIGGNSMTWSDLNPIFSSSELRVISQDADMFGPEIIDLVQVPGQIVNVPAVSIIGWDFKVYDKLNGFEYGNITVVSEFDQTEYTFVLNPALETQAIRINLNATCISQSFSIKSLYLVDKGGYESDINNGFINYLDLTYQKINVTCPGIATSYPPVLKSFTASKTSVDVGSNDRVVHCILIVEDETHGINIHKLPYIYISANNEIIKKQMKFQQLSGSEATFVCSIELPYGFGYPENVLVSVYGVANNAGILAGFPSTSITGVIKTTIFNVNSFIYIESTSEITYDGGKLIIFGKALFKDGMITKVKLDYNDGRGYQQISTPSFSSATVLIIDDVKPTNKPFIISISKNGGFVSNEFTVTPIPSPIYPPLPPSSSSSSSSSTQSSSSSSSEVIPTSSPNKCLNDCGGELQGKCSSAGCICYSPWTGIDCTSKVIIIPTPTINNTIPSTNISIPGTNNNDEKKVFTGLISLVELQELNQNGEKVYGYPFTQWTWSNISTPEEPIKYLYSTDILNQLDQTTTTVNVSIQYFDKEQTITFAGEILNMNQFSIKYSINITSYSFTSSFNQLELIMRVSLESPIDQGCSLLESGNTTTTNSEYIKLQINDHSLYGRFIKRGIIDGRISSISNQILSNYNSNQFNNIQSYIGIGIRSYKTLAQLDPDFSVLIDQRPATSTSTSSICVTPSSKKLTTGQLAGIIIGSIGFAAVIVTSVVYYFYKKRKDAQFKNNVVNKLKNFNN